MERAVAIKKLGKILGKSLGYRIDPKAPDHDERVEAREKLKIASAECGKLKEQKDARLYEILRADAEYQRLKAAHADASQTCDKLTSIAHHYRITVGVSNSIFFHVKAQGDSWEDVIAKLTEKQTA